ncbi:hypothetical protein C8N35_11515 [Breoghania corrubedonensis]|uniref:Uncharacterized protein n=1 Tax=Breoghania corrubedonensis TaxID=665038 RepID=A0A2T5UQW1_9HYPH|nr:hypothetical protein [Breoghania corrubedonensis]PTW53895.1 hypothetical protein C8N35_11515 [Breoghania corrubedonensis]
MFKILSLKNFCFVAGFMVTLAIVDQLFLFKDEIRPTSEVGAPAPKSKDSASLEVSNWLSIKGSADLEKAMRPGGTVTVTSLSTEGTSVMATEAGPPPSFETMSNMELARHFKEATGEDQATIIKVIKARDQRATAVAGEFFPEMVLANEHNAYIRVTRAIAGQAEAVPSELMRSEMAVTAEPTTFAVENTETTNRVGARLFGANFAFEPQETQWAYIPDGEEHTFTWKVTPKSEGNQQITVILENKLIFGDQEVTLPVRQFPKTITVTVDIWTWIGRVAAGADTAASTAKNIGIVIALMGSLLAALGIGGSGVALARWRKTRA